MNREHLLSGAVKFAISILESHGIPYHVTGGLASIKYGESRTTVDADIVVRLGTEAEKAALFLKDLSEEFLVQIQSLKEIKRDGNMFQALQDGGVIRIDFYNRELVPGEIERGVQGEILPGILGKMVSKEDAILSKLIWISKGSHRSRRDVVMMLRNTIIPIDRSLLERLAIQLNVMPLLAEMDKRAAQPDEGEVVEY